MFLNRLPLSIGELLKQVDVPEEFDEFAAIGCARVPLQPIARVPWTGVERRACEREQAQQQG